MRILVICDVDFIGGHELMTARIFNLLSQSSSVHVTVCGCEEVLSLFDDSVLKVSSRLVLRPLSGSLGLLYLTDYWRIFKHFGNFSAYDVVVISQGTIEYGIRYLFYLKYFTKLKVISYIPFIQDLVKSGSSWFPSLRNRLNSVHYKFFDGFIAIDNSLKSDLIRLSRLDDSQILVVTNWIEVGMTSIIKESDRDIVCLLKENRLKGVRNIAIIGRIDLLHKQQDKFLKYFVASSLSDKVGLFFFGDGKDSTILKDLVLSTGSSNIIGPRRLSSIDAVLPLIDIVVSCSSHEGVPLNILEALYYEVEVVSFRYPSIVNYLPEGSLVDLQNFEEILIRIEHILQGNGKKRGETVFNNRMVDIAILTDFLYTLYEE